MIIRFIAIGIAALFLATGTAQSEELLKTTLPHCEENDTRPCWRETTREELLKTMNSPSYRYAEKDYIWDCETYKWKGHGKPYCVTRGCRGNPPEVCASGNWGRVPRKLRRQQLRELGRVPHERYVLEKK